MSTTGSITRCLSSVGLSGRLPVILLASDLTMKSLVKRHVKLSVSTCSYSNTADRLTDTAPQPIPRYAYCYVLL